MHKQKDGTRSDRPDPSFLLLRRRVPLRQRAGIFEIKNSRFKTDVMLAEIAEAPGFVPLKSPETQRPAYDSAPSESRQYKCTYSESRRQWGGIGMAERVGFEPTSPVLPGYPLSRRALSTAQTPLRGRSPHSLANAPNAHNHTSTTLCLSGITKRWTCAKPLFNPSQR
jgi:hypothetical protein